ncbi:hypothetical protein [Tunturiibacter gelidiferens]|uniref:hypothetical protein n=1 Tax=Tunturiibacter gelidiferens TaxID=3069689 RepID=UPI003D9BA9AB
MLEETRRRMLRLKTSGAWKLTGARRTGQRAFFGVLATGLLMTGATLSRAQATSSSATPQATQNTVPIANTKIALAAPVTYDNKYEFYVGINFMNFQAGQSLPKRMNMGGGEFLATYWLPGITGSPTTLELARSTVARRELRLCLARRRDCRTT